MSRTTSGPRSAGKTAALAAVEREQQKQSGTQTGAQASPDVRGSRSSVRTLSEPASGVVASQRASAARSAPIAASSRQAVSRIATRPQVRAAAHAVIPTKVSRTGVEETRLALRERLEEMGRTPSSKD